MPHAQHLHVQQPLRLGRKTVAAKAALVPHAAHEKLDVQLRC